MSFSDAERASLCGALRLRRESERDLARSLPARELLDEATCTALLDRLGPVILSPSRRITASLLGKRQSFLLTGACLYAMSAYDKGLELSLDNTFIEYGHDDGLWTSSLPLRSLAVSRPEPGARGPPRQRARLARVARRRRRARDDAVGHAQAGHRLRAGALPGRRVRARSTSTGRRAPISSCVRSPGRVRRQRGRRH